MDNASKRRMPDAARRRIFDGSETTDADAPQKQQKLVFLQAKENKGYAAGNNIGLNRALADGCGVLVVANNDILFQEQAVKKLADCLASNRKIGIAAPKVVDSKGRIQPSRCGMRTGMTEIFQLYTAAKWLFYRKRQKYHCLLQNPDLPMDVYHVSGCCFAFSRECAQKTLPFDENTFLYYEEPILGIRMEQAGYRTRYEPKSVVVHQHGATAGRMRPLMHTYICQSELYYCARYLHAQKWQLCLLYHYRRMLYALRSFTDRQMRSYLKTFLKKTKLFYQEYTKK